MIDKKLGDVISANEWTALKIHFPSIQLDWNLSAFEEVVEDARDRCDRIIIANEKKIEELEKQKKEIDVLEEKIRIAFKKEEK